MTLKLVNICCQSWNVDNVLNKFDLVINQNFIHQAYILIFMAVKLSSLITFKKILRTVNGNNGKGASVTYQLEHK